MCPHTADDDPARVPLVEHRADVAALLAGRARTLRMSLDAARGGMILADDMRAAVDVPAVDNSQMDGYALRLADIPAGEADGMLTLPVGPPIPAGAAPGDLPPGVARPIMTGAPVPAGADVVVPIEETAEQHFTAAQITVPRAALTPGRNIRRAGSDTHHGDVIARAGTTLSPVRIAHLAACGVVALTVREPLRVLVISTGSEVIPTGAADVFHGATAAPRPDLPAGSAYDANGPGIAAALQALGAKIVKTAHVRDDPADLVSCIRAAARQAREVGEELDLVVTSGGVSAGAYEPVRGAAALPGVRLSFPKVAMQPGGPQGIGMISLDDSAAPIPWIALPGNPVSALLSVELLLRPALGAQPRQVLCLPLRLDHPDHTESSPGHLEQYRRARVLPSGEVCLVGGPSSHLVGALAAATALVRIPVGVDTLRDGERVETILLPEGER